MKLWDSVSGVSRVYWKSDKFWIAVTSISLTSILRVDGLLVLSYYFIPTIIVLAAMLHDPASWTLFSLSYVDSQLHTS